MKLILKQNVIDPPGMRRAKGMQHENQRAKEALG